MALLSYKDCYLTSDDLDLLEDGEWINDRLIDFAFEYMAEEFPTSRLEAVHLCCTSMVQLIKLTLESQVACLLEPLELKEKELLLLPINDSESLDSVGGTHWSLVIINQSEGTAHHFDSMNQNNHTVAMETLEKFKHGLQDKMAIVKLVEANSPQQSNCHDCGMYVIAIAKHYLKKQQVMSLNGDDITKLRAEYKQLILKLAGGSG